MQIKTTVTIFILYYFLAIFSLPIVCAQTAPHANFDQSNAIEEVSGLTPKNVTQEKILPGLTVRYYLEYFKRDVRYLQKMKEGEFQSFEGPPITQLNHQFHKSKVFDSGTNRGVAMRMKGFLYFDQRGVYGLQALSNDGIVLYISDKLVLSDPKQHSDRLSPQGHVHILQSGWYPLSIDYFQRKGTSALKLYWKKPGDASYGIVPSEVYGHIK